MQNFLWKSTILTRSKNPRLNKNESIMSKCSPVFQYGRQMEGSVLSEMAETPSESHRWPDSVSDNNVRLWPGCSWRWCSGLAPPLPLGSSGSPGSQGLNSKQQIRMIKRKKTTTCIVFFFLNAATDWEGWFCICLWSCVQGHRAPLCSQSSWGSSVEETGRCGTYVPHTHFSVHAHAWNRCV